MSQQKRQLQLKYETLNTNKQSLELALLIFVNFLDQQCFYQIINAFTFKLKIQQMDDFKNQNVDLCFLASLSKDLLEQINQCQPYKQGSLKKLEIIDFYHNKHKILQDQYQKKIAPCDFLKGEAVEFLGKIHQIKVNCKNSIKNKRSKKKRFLKKQLLISKKSLEEKIEICLFHYKHCKSNCLAKKVQVDKNLIEFNYNDCKINLNASSKSLHTNHEFIYQTPPRVSSLNKMELNN